jgi:hypothetical protein
MADIPGENLIRTGLQRAACDQRIIDGPAGDVPTSGLLQDGKKLFAIKANASKPGNNIFDTGQRLGSRGFVGLGNRVRVE